MSRIILLLSICFLIFSCQQVNSVEEINIENKYCISIPSFLTKSNSLNEDASLQYQHARKELYVIVIDEQKEYISNMINENNLESQYSNNLQGYTDLTTAYFRMNVQGFETSSIIDTIINDLPCKSYNFTGNVSNIDLYYSVSIYEGKTRYYRVMTWTLANKKYEHIEKMKNIVESLKEL